MIRSYGFSIIGSSHTKKGSKCQDNNKIITIHKDQMVIAAVADGVGSCKFSDISSKIAVEVSAEYCAEKLKVKANFKKGIENLIEEAFEKVELEIEKISLKDNQPLSEYDTTLDLVIYTGKKIFFGHCGDGGIIGLTTKGDYIRVTSIQKKDGIYVIPLRGGSKKKNNTWAFGSVKDEFSSVLIATDGIYDLFFPYLLKGQSIEIYIPLIQYFMDNNGLHVSAKTIDEISESRKSFLNSKECESVTDDKTLVVLIDETIMPKRKESSFYAEPDWDALLQEWNKKAYPHLYTKTEDTTHEQQNNQVKETDESNESVTRKHTIKEISEAIKRYKDNNKA